MDGVDYRSMGLGVDRYGEYIRARANLVLEHFKRRATRELRFNPRRLLGERAVNRRMLEMIVDELVQMQAHMEEQHLVRVRRRDGLYTEREVFEDFPELAFSHAYRMRQEADEYARRVATPGTPLFTMEVVGFLAMRIGGLYAAEELNGDVSN